MRQKRRFKVVLQYQKDAAPYATCDFSVYAVNKFKAIKDGLRFIKKQVKQGFTSMGNFDKLQIIEDNING